MGSTELGVGVLLLIASVLVAAVWGRDSLASQANGKGAQAAPGVSAPAAAPPPGEPLTR